MANLKKDHGELYKRVTVKAIVHVLLGISLVWFSPSRTPNARGTVMEKLLSLHQWGWVFLLIGLFIFLGLYRSRTNYKLARMSLAVATGHAMMWLLALIYGLFTGNPSGLSVIILWGFFTYKLFELTSDAGWAVVEVIKEVKSNGNGDSNGHS